MFIRGTRVQTPPDKLEAAIANFKQHSSFDPSYGVGAGIRVTTPIGPIRLRRQSPFWLSSDWSRSGEMFRLPTLVALAAISWKAIATIRRGSTERAASTCSDFGSSAGTPQNCS